MQAADRSAVLVLYLTTRLGLPDRDAALASGAYLAFTFMSPIPGGFVADKVLGLRYSVSVGGVLILIGNLILAWREALLPVFTDWRAWRSAPGSRSRPSR